VPETRWELYPRRVLSVSVVLKVTIAPWVRPRSGSLQTAQTVVTKLECSSGQTNISKPSWRSHCGISWKCPFESALHSDFCCCTAKIKKLEPCRSAFQQVYERARRQSIQKCCSLVLESFSVRILTEVYTSPIEECRDSKEPG
jgi:hypothetical protein